MAVAKAEFGLKPVGDLRGFHTIRNARRPRKTLFSRHSFEISRRFASLRLDIVQIGLKAHQRAAQAIPRRIISRAGPWSITLA